VLSETYPNRLVLYSGTSGGNTSNDINNGTLSYPCVLDLLSGNGITFKNYNFHFARPGFVDTTYSEHSSVLKFIETVFGLPALASINHMFDKSTPEGEQPGQRRTVPAPWREPRDQ
jgi:hypothetical protein